MPIRILLCCDDALFAAGLKALLERQPGLAVLEEAGADGLTLAAVQHQLPDAVLVARRSLDAEDLPAISKVTAVVWLADADDPEQTLRALSAGVRAVLSASPSPDELLAALRLVAVSGALVMPPSLRNQLEEAVAAHSYQSSPALETLTQREREVLRLLAHGLSNVDIARKLFVSTSTVRSHVHHMLGKLGVKSRAQAVTVAYRAGLIGGRQDLAESNGDADPVA